MLESEAKKILNIEGSFDEISLKKAFRKLAVRYHPDRNPDNKEAEGKIRDINAAYETLTDSLSTKNKDSRDMKDIAQDVGEIAKQFFKQKRSASTFSSNQQEFRDRYKVTPERSIDDMIRDNFGLDTNLNIASILKDNLLFTSAIKIIDDEFLYDTSKADKYETLQTLVSFSDPIYMKNIAATVIKILEQYKKYPQPYDAKQFNQIIDIVRPKISNLGDIIGLIELAKCLRYIDSSKFAEKKEFLTLMLEERNIIQAKEFADNFPILLRYAQKNTYLPEIKKLNKLYLELKVNLYSTDNYNALLSSVRNIKESKYIGANLYGLNRIASFIEMLGEKIIPSHVSDFREFVDNLDKAARNYDDGNRATETWKKVIDDDFPTYIKHKDEYNGIFYALSQLKCNAEGEVEWWPGVFHITVDAACKIATSLVTCHNFSKSDIMKFDEDLSGFRYSIQYNKKNSASAHLNETYGFLAEIRNRKNEKLRLKSQDAETFLNLYLSERA